jgi:hypothetical protein
VNDTTKKLRVIAEAIIRIASIAASSATIATYVSNTRDWMGVAVGLISFPLAYYGWFGLKDLMNLPHLLKGGEST